MRGGSDFAIFLSKKNGKFLSFSLVFGVLCFLFFTLEPLKGFLDRYNVELRAEIYFLIYAAILSLLALLYGYGSRVFRKESPNFKSLVFVFFLLNISLMFIWPIASGDFFSYIYQGRVLSIHEANPFISTFTEFPQDKLFYSLENSWSGEVTPYGPVFIYLMGVVTFLGGSSLFVTFILTKLLFVLVNLGILFLLNKMYKDNFLNYLYVFNPLFITEFIINGHNDSMLLFLVLASLFFFFKKGRGNILLANGILLLAIFVKVHVIIFLPLLFLFSIFQGKSRSQKIENSYLIISSLIALTIVWWFPFFEGKEVFRGMLQQGSKNSLLLSSPLVFIICGITYAQKGFSSAWLGSIVNYCRVIFVFTSGMFYLLFLNRVKKLQIMPKKELIVMCYIIILSWFYFTSFAWLLPWYWSLLIFLFLINFKSTKKDVYLWIAQGITLWAIFSYIFVR